MKMKSYVHTLKMKLLHPTHLLSDVEQFLFLFQTMIRACLLCDFQAESKTRVFIHMRAEHRDQVLDLFAPEHVAFEECSPALPPIEGPVLEAQQFFDEKCIVFRPSEVNLNAIYKCDASTLCNYQTMDLQKFAEHISYSSNQSLQCHICDARRCSQQSIDLHLFKKHPEENSELATQRKSYHCYLCDREEFLSLSNLKRHFFMTHLEEELNESKVIITNPGEIPCRKCLVSFPNKAERKHHLCVALFQTPKTRETKGKVLFFQ